MFSWLRIKLGVSELESLYHKVENRIDDLKVETRAVINPMTKVVDKLNNRVTSNTNAINGRGKTINELKAEVKKKHDYLDKRICVLENTKSDNKGAQIFSELKAEIDTLKSEVSALKKELAKTNAGLSVITKNLQKEADSKAKTSPAKTTKAK